MSDRSGEGTTKGEGMNDWQPIESAPKDGTEILLFTPGDDLDAPGRAIGFWSEGLPRIKFVQVEGDELWHREITKPDGRFVTHGSFGVPTLWQPLPQPPAESPARTSKEGE